MLKTVQFDTLRLFQTGVHNIAESEHEYLGTRMFEMSSTERESTESARWEMMVPKEVPYSPPLMH